MSELKLGDTVCVTNRRDIHWGAVGRITSVCKDPSWDLPFQVVGLSPGTAFWYRADELKLTQPEKP